ncbi:MAG: ubiquinol-cytochrome c reductase cytochrome c subunit [Solirubrobacteraceae bacterium]|nr:ubiquinol-cytochrome c reductase cytochrome c subunit [Solirubrobacteraceae bacterium]
MRRAARRAALALAVACGGMAAWSAAAGGQGAPPPAPARATTADRALVARGRDLYAQSCAGCHGEDLRGRPGQGPSLIGAGAAAVDFYVATGRMPIASPTDEPVGAKPLYSGRDVAALVAYAGAFGGPAIPRVDPARGSVAAGKQSFTERCAGCHQVMARGGIVTGAFVPALLNVTPRQLGEAVRVGPYLMPKFGPRQVDARELDDLAAYVAYTRHPADRGGWAIGNLGPVPEGLVAWLLAGTVLLGVVRLLGERAR